MGDGIRIVFEEDGFPRELIGPRDCARAVKEGTLRPDMDVTVYRDGETPGVSRADAIDELRPFFETVSTEAEPEPPAEAPVAEMLPTPWVEEPPTAPTDEIRLAVPASDPDPPPTQAGARNRGTAEPPARKALPPAPIDNSQPPDEPRPSGPSGFWIAGAIVVVVVLLGMCSTKRDQAPAPAPTQSTTENVSDTEDMIEITNASDGPAAVTAEEVANSVVRYIAADTNVRAEATSSSRLVTKLLRGVSIRGVTVPGVNPAYQWFKITAGDYAGYYVSADRNLSERSPPALDTAFSGVMPVYLGLPIYAEPDSASKVLRYSEPWTKLTVFGAVSDEFAEVAVRPGEAGYIARSAFDPATAGGDVANQAEPSESISAPAPTGSGESEDAPVRTSSVLLNGATLFSTDDYPAASLRSGNEGRVRYIVSVSASGTPIDCRITSSSGHALLDSTTCRLVRQRARFRPAVNIVGRATADNYLGSVEWKLPD